MLWERRDVLSVEKEESNRPERTGEKNNKILKSK